MAPTDRPALDETSPPIQQIQISTMTAWKYAWFKAHAKPTDGQDLRPHRKRTPSGLDEVLYATVRRWLGERWPFTRVAWPGRDHPPVRERTLATAKCSRNSLASSSGWCSGSQWPAPSRTSRR